MENTAFDNDGEPTLVSMKTNDDVKKEVELKDSSPVHLENGIEEAKKVALNSDYEIVIEGEDGEKKIVIREEMDMENEPPAKPYPDMGKEDLLRFSETVFWQRARLISILLFWAAWLALLGAAIGLTIVAPRCGAPPNPPWWQKTAIYQIYVRSFYDSDNTDGIGDLNGIADKLDYIKELGAGAILISSFYLADDNPGSADYGYQVLDHKAILPTYGTMTDFERLVNETHKRDMAILLDFIPNYTSENHTWFTESKANPSDYNNPYWNYYIWADCTSYPPNNWKTVYGEDAWTKPATGTAKCYLHQFLKSQPELNLRSKSVQDEMESILKFWLGKGVDGFRVVASAYLFESQDLQNETETCNTADLSQAYDCLGHEYTRSQPEGYELIARWRSIVDSYNASGSRPRVLLTDGDVEVKNAMNFYGTYGRGGGAHLPINYHLTKINDTCDSKCIGRLVYAWLDHMPQGGTADWLNGDQDRSRQMSLVDGENFVNVFNMIKMTLPGTAFVYYGEEVGMVNANITGIDPVEQLHPKFSRAGYRTPMQWTNETNAGFTNSTTTWIPVPTQSNSDPWNVEAQKTLTDGVMAKLRRLLQLRVDEKSLQFGKLHKVREDHVFAFVREHEGFNRVIVAGSFGNDTATTVDLTKSSSGFGVSWWADVVFVTNSSMAQKVGESTDLRKVTLQPGHGFIATWAYQRP